MFYSPQEALNWLKGKIAALFAARGVLQDAYGRALVLQNKAQTTTAREQADRLVASITSSLRNQGSLESKVRAVVPSSWLPQTLGLFPIILGIGAIAVAGAVYAHLNNVAEHRKTLEMVERGLLTPQQAITLQQTGSIFGGGGLSGLTGNLSTIMLAGAALYALVLFGPMFSRR
jgi:hypothetical protein